MTRNITCCDGNLFKLRVPVGLDGETKRDRMDSAMRKIIFFVCLAILANFSFAQKTQTLPLPKQLKADTLPAFYTMLIKTAEGKYIDINKDDLKTIAEQRKSRKVVLSFYATYCVPCRTGLKKMSDSSAVLEKNNILVVLVNVNDQDSDKISKWEKEYAKEGWLLGLDQACNLPKEFGLVKEDCAASITLPKTLLLDSNLRPKKLIGTEGNDFLQILKE